nr:response regulator [Paraburkholderia atlantica]
MREIMLVTVVDDDEAVRESLPDLVRMFGYAVNVFASAEAFLASGVVDQTDCLVLDVNMTGKGGLGLFSELKRLGQKIPVVFITAHKDEAVRERLLMKGASDCLFKPFSDTALLAALQFALGENCK